MKLSKLRTRLFAALLIIVIIVAIVVVIGVIFVFRQQNSFSPSSAVLEPAAPSYIGNSRIYLISAKPSYGIYQGTAVFMINVTVRNDYSLQQPPPNLNPPFYNGSTAFFVLSAHLYDKNGARINSNLYGSTITYWEVELNDGQTTSLVVYMATSSRDVDHYTLNFIALGGSPVP